MQRVPGGDMGQQQQQQWYQGQQQQQQGQPMSDQGGRGTVAVSCREAAPCSNTLMAGWLAVVWRPLSGVLRGSAALRCSTTAAVSLHSSQPAILPHVPFLPPPP
jgi:hypothetical protein